jgi:dihydropyrimidinase
MTVLWHHGVRTGRLTPAEFVAVTSANTAKIFNVFGKKGTIAPGADADVVVWDPAKTRTISAKTHHQNIDVNIYEGMETVGNPALTFVRGHLAWDGKDLHTVRGYGRYVDRPCHSPFFANQMLRNRQHEPTAVTRVRPTPAR